MPDAWRILTLVLIPTDLLASIGLWRGKRWGAWLVVAIALYELLAFIGFRDVFGDQSFLIAFHAVTLVALVALSRNATGAAPFGAAPAQVQSEREA